MMTTPQQLNRAALDALHNVLDEEIRQYEATLVVLTRKKEILVTGKPQVLGQIDRELMTLSQRAVQLEKQRLAVMHQMGTPHMTLEKLITRMSSQDAGVFNVLRNKLRRLVQDVARMNQESRDLLELSLQWIHDTVEVLANVLTPEASSYNAQGNKARHAGSGPSPGSVQSTISHSA